MLVSMEGCYYQLHSQPFGLRSKKGAVFDRFLKRASNIIPESIVLTVNIEYVIGQSQWVLGSERELEINVKNGI